MGVEQESVERWGAWVSVHPRFGQAVNQARRAAARTSIRRRSYRYRTHAILTISNMRAAVVEDLRCSGSLRARHKFELVRSLSS